MRRVGLLLVLSVAALVGLDAQLVTLPQSLQITTMGYAIDGSGVTLNATGEYSGVVGALRLQGGSGSKTLSAAGGGSIIWEAAGGSITDGGSDFRVGIQDVATDGLPDGTFDVYGAAVTPVGVAQKTVMSSGSKSMTHGAMYCILVKAEVRAGADSLVPDRIQSSRQSRMQASFPYGVNNTGTPATNENLLPATILFDDGTVGWIEGFPFQHEMSQATSSTTVGTGTTPDELAAVIALPFRFSIDDLGWGLDNVVAGDDYELIIYADPEGTPTVMTSVSADPDFYTGTGQFLFYPVTRTTFDANTLYGLAVRPTTANTISVNFVTLPANAGATAGVAAAMKKAQPFTTLKMSGRSDQTGAFAEVNPIHLPLIGISISQLDAGGDGGERSGVF